VGGSTWCLGSSGKGTERRDTRCGCAGHARPPRYPTAETQAARRGGQPGALGWKGEDVNRSAPTFPFFVQDAELAVSPKPATRQFNWVLSAAVRGCTSICCDPLEPPPPAVRGGGLDPPGLHSYYTGGGGGRYLPEWKRAPRGAQGPCPNSPLFSPLARYICLRLHAIYRHIHTTDTNKHRATCAVRPAARSQ
jgi:hypothetical protein